MISWPGGARAAAVITVNFDAELFWLRLHPSVAERPKTRSLGEYGGRRGAPRLLDALAAAKVPSTWFVCSDLAESYREVLERVAAEGHCLASRGPGLTDFASSPPEVQRLALENSRDVLAHLAGLPPTGFRPPGDISDVTVSLLLAAGYRWSSITRGDDRPVLLKPPAAEGSESVVDLPRPWDLDDTSRFLFNYVPAFPPGQCRIASYGALLADWKAEFDAVYDLGLCFVLSLEPQAIGTPGRIGLLEELLAHITSRPDVWLATGQMIEAFWREHGSAEDSGPEEVRRREALRLAPAAGPPAGRLTSHSSSPSGPEVSP